MDSVENLEILIADDHQMFIDGVKALLRNEKHLVFKGEVHDGKEALAFLESNQVDLLISDLTMPEMNGIELTKAVKTKYPDVKVLVLSMHADKEMISEILLAEAEGYILKNTGKNELKKAIECIAEGGTHYSQEVLTILMNKISKQEKADREINNLTERELEIVKLIVQEYSTADIADQLHISPRTVDTHRKNIMQKTSSKTIIGLMKYAFRNGLIA